MLSSRIRRFAWVGVCSAALLACERRSDPAGVSRAALGHSVGAPSGEGASTSSPATSSTVQGEGSHPAGSATRARPTCERPLVEPPPPPAAKAADCPRDPDGDLELETVEVRFVDASGSPRVLAEHAQDHRARQRGLMYRTELPEDAGMLFSWPDQTPRSFWMKNTCIPLDMLFIDRDGFIVSVLEQVPTMNTLPRHSGCPAKRVLELNAGWVRAHGVRPGQRVEIR